MGHVPSALEKPAISPLAVAPPFPRFVREGGPSILSTSLPVRKPAGMTISCDRQPRAAVAQNARACPERSGRDGAPTIRNGKEGFETLKGGPPAESDVFVGVYALRDRTVDRTTGSRSQNSNLMKPSEVTVPAKRLIRSKVKCLESWGKPGYCADLHSGH